MQKQRISGIDIIKTLAVLFVISIHQIGMTHILAFNLTGIKPFTVMFFRYLVMSCVPLFMITTGYLQNKKTISKKFYYGLFSILVSYLFISLITVYINIRCMGEQFSVKNSVINILNFTENNYAWYVEMFIGLYVIIPFLNIMYHGINSRNGKRLLLFIFSLITVLPGLAISFKTDIFADYWVFMYPVTYYLIGAYFSEYKIRINKALNILLLVIAVLIPVLWIFGVAHGGEFESFSYIMNGFDSLSAFAISILIFMLFYDIDIKFKPVKALLKDVSVSSLEIYLMSNITEKVLYRHIQGDIHFRLPIMIVIIFISAYFCAKVQRIVFWIIKKYLIKKKTF